MTIVRIPYGTSKITVEVPDDNFYFVAWSRSLPGTKYIGFEIERALSKAEVPLDSVVDDKDKILVILDSRLPWWAINGFVRVIKNKLEDLGANKIDFVRTSNLYLTNISQEAIRREANIPRFYEYSSLVFTKLDLPYLGLIDVWNGIFDYDKRIFVAYADYHEFWGYSSYVDLIVEGLSNKDVVEKVYSYFLNFKIYSFDSRKNPVLKSISEFLVKNNIADYFIGNIFNIVGELVRTYADEPISALKKIQKFIDGMYRVEFTRMPEIVLLSAGGYPSDRYWWWAIRSILRSNQALTDSVIFIGDCSDLSNYASSISDYIRFIVSAVSDVLGRIRDLYVYGNCLRILRRLRKQNVFRVHNIQGTLRKLLSKEPHARVLVAPHGDETYLVFRGT